ncbi:MAG: nucleotidyltransferase domain-containing protein [Clostridia bacterium]|nr:nucleotidyltransferase domain-containing protein [Clostridia bacterium]
MQYNLPQGVINNMVDFAIENDVSKIILFGSRARGTNTERSDIDIAVTGGDFDGFYRDITENANSLLCFDIVNIDNGISTELQLEIERDGVVLYEKTG